MKLRKVFHKAPASSARIPRLLTLCAFFAAGIVAGQVAQHAVTGGELADYLRSYAGMVAENGAAQASLLRVAVAYLREPTINEIAAEIGEQATQAVQRAALASARGERR